MRTTLAKSSALRVAAAAALALGLAGCLSDDVNKGIGSLVGQDIGVAVDRFGDPDSTRTVPGDRIYTWSTSREDVLPATMTSTTINRVGAVSMYGGATGMTYEPANFSCTIQFSVGPDDKIRSWQWSGNLGGCSQYVRLVSR